MKTKSKFIVFSLPIVLIIALCAICMAGLRSSGKNDLHLKTNNSNFGSRAKVSLDSSISRSLLHKSATDLMQPTITNLPELQKAKSVIPFTANAASAKKHNSAVVIFTFDDSSESDYVFAYPILRKYGIIGTSYVITKYTDENYTGRLTWEQITAMSSYGWIFGCHTYDHRRLTSMTDEEIRNSMELVDQSFINHGFQSPDIMAYPYGAYNQRVIDDIKPYRKQARLAYYRTAFVNLNYVNPYEIPSISADMRTKKQLKKLERLIDKACTRKAVVVFRVHCLYKKRPYDTVIDNRKILGGNAPQTSSVLFEELVKYCVDKSCSFINMEQLMELYS